MSKHLMNLIGKNYPFYMHGEHLEVQIKMGFITKSVLRTELSI
jgi:hypothetical protein